VRSQSREGVDGVEPLEVTIAPSGIASNDTLAACYTPAGFGVFSTPPTSLGLSNSRYNLITIYCFCQPEYAKSPMFIGLLKNIVFFSGALLDMIST
jgi:hypothetical protein